jgi:hypothetical protein
MSIPNPSVISDKKKLYGTSGIDLPVWAGQGKSPEPVWEPWCSDHHSIEEDTVWKILVGSYYSIRIPKCI